MTASVDGHPALTLRAWAKAYRDHPQYRFPSDPNAEFFPQDMDFGASEIELLTADNERLRSALKPFAELYGPYRYDGAHDAHIVRSAGTLGKGGDRGYCYITVADLRIADELVNRADHEQATPKSH